MTINSSDEIETFKEFLSPHDFDFVELLPSKVNVLQDHSTHWFHSACQKDYKCDILIVSGHFGGTFFGESGYALPTELLEEKACQKSCSGILSNVKEIFLFGCNTLADKKKDSRSYTEYLQVLLDDGMARESAERVVAARYSPLETPFHARMNFIFSNSHTIYGFDQLSPLGKHIRQPLRNYLRSINKNFGDYANYLKTEKYKRPRNKELFQHLSHTTLDQAHLSLSNEQVKERNFFNDKCLLYDNTKGFDQRISALKNIFETKQSDAAFFAIDYFLQHNKPTTMGRRGREVFRYIKNNSEFKRQFLSYKKHLNHLPYIKITYLNLLKKFQWISPIDLSFLIKKSLLNLIKKPNPESYITLLLLLKDKQIFPDQIYISKKDLPKDYVQNIWSLLIFEKLKSVVAPEWQKDILQYCEDNLKKQPAICYQALNTLAHIKPTLETAKHIIKFLSSEDRGLIYFGIRALGQSEIESQRAHRKIAGFFTHEDPEIREEAVSALGFLKSPYPNIQDDLAQLIKFYPKEQILSPHQKEQNEKIFWSLSQMDIQGEFAQKKIIEYAYQVNSWEEVKKAFQTFQNTSEFSDFTLSFFYHHLESRENLDFLLYIVETLSRYKHLRDFGVHYRFLLFQEEESVDLKRKALKRMVSLKWLNPEIQVHFLDYMKDSDPVVRKSAVKVLKNITNLTEETLEEIIYLYQKENIKELNIFF